MFIMEQDEGCVVADLSILEFYLHRSIVLRLKHHGTNTGESFYGLKQAKLHSLIVQDILDVLKISFDGSLEEIPFDKVLKKRLIFGAALGFLFFDRSGNTVNEIIGGYLKAVPLLKEIGISIPANSLRSCLLEIKKLIMMGMCRNRTEAATWIEDNFAEDLSETEFQAVKQEFSALESESLYNTTRARILSESNVMTLERLVISTLKDIYAMVEPPIIAKMSHKLLETFEPNHIEHSQSQPESQKTMELYTQAAPMNTQAYPDSIPFVQTQAFPVGDNEDDMPAASQTTDALLERSPPVLPRSSQEPNLSSQELPENIPIEVFKFLMSVCDKEPEVFFSGKDEVLDAVYEKYHNYLLDQEWDRRLPPLSSLIPKDASPTKLPTKRLSFEGDADVDNPEEAYEEARKKISLLLPNETAKKLEWETQSASDENEQPLVQESQESQPIPSKPAIASAIPSTSQSSQPYPLSAIAAAATTAPTATKTTRGRRPFSEAEVLYLKEGIRRFGRRWTIILCSYKFNDRTSIDLKDKARNLFKKGEIQPFD